MREKDEEAHSKASKHLPLRRHSPLPEYEPPESSDPERARRVVELVASESFIRADGDSQLLQRDELRHVRLGLEYLKPELALQERGIRSTIVLFGGTRVMEPAKARQRLEDAKRSLAREPDSGEARSRVAVAERLLDKSRYYDVAREFARRVGEHCRTDGSQEHWVVTTGGGPGIMEAGNRGAYDAGCPSIGFNITLPEEQFPNAYVSADLCFRFRYFALRKLHFLLRAKALVAFPGGYGTLDELFDALCLIQTRKIEPMPLILVGREFWTKTLNVQFLLEEGVIDPEDVELIQYAEDAEEILGLIRSYYGEQD